MSVVAAKLIEVEFMTLDGVTQHCRQSGTGIQIPERAAGIVAHPVVAVFQDNPEKHVLDLERRRRG